MYIFVLVVFIVSGKVILCSELFWWNFSGSMLLVVEDLKLIMWWLFSLLGECGVLCWVR